MLSSFAAAVVAMLTALLPLLGGASTQGVAAIIKALMQIIPLVVQEATDLVAPIQAIIAALGANPAATSDQLAALEALDAQCDAAFDAAGLADGLS